MDIAKNFQPKTILLWEKVSDHPEAQRITSMFPSANIKLIEHQRLPELNMSPSEALLKSKRTLMIGHAKSFVGNFNGKLGDNVHCMPYYKLVPLSNGCPYYCTYCYLAYVYRKFSPYIKININYDLMFKQIRKTLAHCNPDASFNMGEMLDSLALDHITNLTSELIPFFSSLSKGYLMLLTKSGNINNLLKLKPSHKTVVSWSLNPEHVITQYEKGTASLDERIEAARKCQEKGYRIRVRIDPGILNLPKTLTVKTQRIFSQTSLLKEPRMINFATDRTCVSGSIGLLPIQSAVIRETSQLAYAAKHQKYGTISKTIANQTNATA